MVTSCGVRGRGAWNSDTGGLSGVVVGGLARWEVSREAGDGGRRWIRVPLTAITFSFTNQLVL